MTSAEQHHYTALTKSLKAPSLARNLLPLLVFQPELGAKVELRELRNVGAEAEAKALEALLEYIHANPQMRSTALVLQHFAVTPYAEIFRQISGEILDWDEAFDVEAEFEMELAGVLEKRSKKLTDVEFSALLKKKLSDLSPEEKQLMQQYRSVRN